MKNEAELSELRRKWLALEGDDAAEIHGWLIGIAVAVERKRKASPAIADYLIAELRASAHPGAAAATPEGTLNEQ